MRPPYIIGLITVLFYRPFFIGRKFQQMTILSITKAVVDMVGDIAPDLPAKAAAHLDIGAGTGELIVELGKTGSFSSSACDYHIDRFPLADTVPIKKVDMNLEPLPYPDNSFDLVTSTEVVEHLENPRLFVREIHRVLKPGGYAVLSTPNVLNVKSRVRYLGAGFFNLFSPLPMPDKTSELYSTNTHITPTGLFYLCHSLYRANFDSLEATSDRAQKTSILWLVLFSPLIFVLWFFFLLKERRRKPPTGWYGDAAVRELVLRQNSWKTLTGRTLVIRGRKPLV